MDKELKNLGKALGALIVTLLSLSFEVLFVCFLWCLICWGFGLGFTWPGAIGFWAAVKALNIAVRGLTN